MRYNNRIFSRETHSYVRGVDPTTSWVESDQNTTRPRGTPCIAGKCLKLIIFAPLNTHNSITPLRQQYGCSCNCLIMMPILPYVLLTWFGENLVIIISGHQLSVCSFTQTVFVTYIVLSDIGVRILLSYLSESSARDVCRETPQEAPSSYSSALNFVGDKRVCVSGSGGLTQRDTQCYRH